MAELTRVQSAPNIQSLITDVSSVKYDHSAIQGVVLQHLRDITDGTVDIVDPTNPFIFALESACVLAASNASDYQTLIYKKYPTSSQTYQDLYLHMCDKDYVDRFSLPSSGTFFCMVQYDELIKKMVYDSTLDCKKVTIPVNTAIKVSDYTFTLQYPIEIRLMSHGGLQVVYNTDNTSPLQSLTTNVISWMFRIDSSGNRYVYFEFPLYQFFIISKTDSIQSAVSSRMQIGLTDNYYFARVFYQNSTTSEWVEMQTTHTLQIYDEKTPTAALTVVPATSTTTGYLQVYIPQVYVNTGLVSGKYRVDVYQTKGNITLLLDNYMLQNFSATFKAIDSNDNDAYVAAWNTITGKTLASKSVVSGGRDPLSLDDLRKRVIQNANGDKSKPITNVDITDALANSNYKIVANVDVVTNRQFLASRTMPTPVDPKLITPAAASIQTLTVSFSQLQNFSSVRLNDNHLTLTPDLIYRLDNGVLSVVDPLTLKSITNMPYENQAVQVNQNKFLYTPFHYVLDTDNNEFVVRPYYLDSPTQTGITFNSQNAATGLEVNSDQIGITKDSAGYTLTVKVASNDAYKALADSNVQAQMSFIPYGEKDRAYLTGTLVGTDATSKERIFQFRITTNFDTDVSHYLSLTSFLMYTTDSIIVKSALVNDFDIIYTTNANITNWTPVAADSYLGNLFLKANSKAITYETVSLKFGDSLDTLWSRSRNIMTQDVYYTYPADVPMLYTEDVYAVDPNTGAKFTIDANGNIQYTILHHKGDQVYDPNGVALMLHYKGDYMLDPQTNKPLIKFPMKIGRELDLFLIEGSYWFATDTAATGYRELLTASVVDWLVSDIETIQEELLEETYIYFYPKQSIGLVSVLTGDGVTTNIDALQSIVVNLYVPNSVYTNTDMRNTLEKNTITIIDTALQNTIISKNEIQNNLASSYGSDVTDVELFGLGGSLNLSVLTMTKDSDRLALRKILKLQSDNTLIVAEDVTINFIRHDLVSLTAAQLNIT